MTTQGTTPTLAGIHELANRFECDRSLIYYWIKQPGFPEPLARLAAGPVYDLESVEGWREGWDAKRR